MWVGYTCDWLGFEISQLNKIEFSLKNPPLQLMCSPTSNFDGLLFLFIVINSKNSTDHPCGFLLLYSPPL